MPLALSRRRAVVGLAGAAILALLVIGNTAALTFFMLEAIAGPRGFVAVGLLWAVAVAALFLLARYRRHVKARAPSSSRSKG